MRDDDPALEASLRRAAAFFSGRPEYLGYWLERYREAEGLDAAAAARLLGCAPETLARLALCLRPRAERLWEDTAELAERYGVNQDALADLLHDAETAEAARAAPPAASGTAPAARAVFAAASDRPRRRGRGRRGEGSDAG